MRKIIFDPSAFEEYVSLANTKSILKRVNRFILRARNYKLKASNFNFFNIFWREFLFVFGYLGENFEHSF